MASERLSLPIGGGCQCGAVRYRIHERPLTLYCCHCLECQAQSASAFGMSMLVARRSLAVDWRAMKVWERDAASGARLACHFCPGCGSRLFHAGSADPGVVSVKAGSLDPGHPFEPVGHLWTARARPWVDIPPGMPAWPGQPDDKTILEARWREASAAWFEDG